MEYRESKPFSSGTEYEVFLYKKCFCIIGAKTASTTNCGTMVSQSSRSKADARC